MVSSNSTNIWKALEMGSGDIVISALDDGVQQFNNHVKCVGDGVGRYGDPSTRWWCPAIQQPYKQALEMGSGDMVIPVPDNGVQQFNNYIKYVGDGVGRYDDPSAGWWCPAIQQPCQMCWRWGREIWWSQRRMTVFSNSTIIWKALEMGSGDMVIPVPDVGVQQFNNHVKCVEDGVGRYDDPSTR